MDLEGLKNTPPWDWPEDTPTVLMGILGDDRSEESDRRLAAQLAGDFTALNDELADALLAIIHCGDESEKLRGVAAISLGPALEHMDELDAVEDEDEDEKVISGEMFRRIQQSLRELFFDADVPPGARRRILEASVRAPQDWHEDAVRTAYSSQDEAWRLTSVFCMCYIRGFDEQILEALDCEDPDTHYQAVCAAGCWEVDPAWGHVAALATSDHTDKHLRLAAIEAAASIRPKESREILEDLTDSADEDIVEAASEALAMFGGLSEYEDHDEEEDEDDDDDGGRYRVISPEP